MHLGPSALFTNFNSYLSAVDGSSSADGRQTKLSTFIAVITYGTTHRHFYLVYT